ncbi:RAS protein activator like-3-like [Discoglossus pictus]
MMVEPCEDDGASVIQESNPSELPSLGPYQWKTHSGQKKNLWFRMQEFKLSRGKPTKGSNKKQLLFKKKKGSQEPNSGGLNRYLRSMSQQLGWKRETCTPIEGTMVVSNPSAPPSTPEVPVWDISDFSLIDGRILLTRGEEKSTFQTRSRAGSCVSNTKGAQNVDAVVDHLPEVNMDCKTTNNVKGLILKRKKKNRRKPSISSSHQEERSLQGSRESLNGMAVMDLTKEKDVIIRALHSSILGEQYCFKVISSKGSFCFGCSSVQECNRWIENLRRVVQPDKDNYEREESSISLWIQEAKGLPNTGSSSRARYFCEIHLDDALYGRTSSKAPEFGVVFWGESFNLTDLTSAQGHVAFHLLREGKETTGVGTVTMALESMKEGVERWVPLGGEVTLRVRGKYRRLCVLPVVKYKEFAEYLTWHYLELSRAMEPILSAREKEELGRSLVYVLQSTGKAKEFLVDLGVAEISRHDVQDSLIFRENTIVTKAIEEYMKMVGQTYLLDTLGPFVTRLCASVDSHEVDPLRCSSEDLGENRGHLWRSCEEAVQNILQSLESFPPELLEVFSAWQEEVTNRGRPELGSRLVSSSLFLRFLCPAILSPGLFNLSPDHPNPLAARAFTLVAKVLQNLANFTRFGEKENYMSFMNGFLEQHWDAMSQFLRTVSDQDNEIAAARFEGSTDLAYELCALHAMLCGIFTGIHQQTKDQLEPLPNILKALQEGNPVPSCITQDPAFNNRLDETAEPEFLAPRDLCKLRPLVNKSQSMISLKRERLAPPTKREEQERRTRRQVIRTQSVPAQSRAGCERRVVADTSAVREKPQGQSESTSQRKQRMRPFSTLPRQKSTVPWCRNEDAPLLGQDPEEVISHNEHLQEMRSQITENLVKQRDMEGQLLALSDMVQKLLRQLTKVEENQKAFETNTTEQLCQILYRVNGLEIQKKPQEVQEVENLDEGTLTLENCLCAMENHKKKFEKTNHSFYGAKDRVEDTPECSDFIAKPAPSIKIETS